jgi:hypothetical protein
VQIGGPTAQQCSRAKRGALRSLIRALSADLFARTTLIHLLGDDAAPLLTECGYSGIATV